MQDSVEDYTFPCVFPQPGYSSDKVGYPKRNRCLKDHRDAHPLASQPFSSSQLCGVFLSEPSSTGDIERIVMYGAQGAQPMTMLLLAADHLGGDPWRP
jgi:hypothetical protein